MNYGNKYPYNLRILSCHGLSVGFLPKLHYYVLKLLFIHSVLFNHISNGFKTVNTTLCVKSAEIS